MNTNNIRTCSALAVALLVAGASLAADIQYAAAGSSGTYGGRGFGIAVDVATPASGATIQYSTSENGPWQDEEIKYTNACPATPIWFKISAEGYSSVTNSRTVAIAPKQLTDEFVWLTLPTQGYVYDGTAKTPKFTCVDGYPSIITSNDVGIAFTDNVNAGTAKATFTGKRNYTGTVEEEFDILARPLTIVADAKSKTFGANDPQLTYTATGLVAGEAISGALAREEGNAVGTYAILQGTLTAGDNYDIDYTGANFTIIPSTIQYAAAGSSGTYGGRGFGIAVDVATPASGATIQYSTSENGPWQDEEIKYTNACPATPIWFKISAEGYSSVTNSRTVAIAPKQLTKEFVWLTLPTQDYVYDGTAKTPKFTCVDGYPSIITSNDVDIAFMDNVNAGTATAIFTGKRNYTGTVEEEFDILARPLTIVADAKSKTYGTGDPQLTYTATGLVAGEAISGALAREEGNTVGTYAILQGTLTAGDNYDIDYTGANFTINPATIQYAADGSSGTYGGRGFGIAVDIATPASGATIQYSTSENGPWQDEEIKYTNACPATPIWFKISAEGYSSVTNSRTVAIAPKQLTDEFVWLTLPTQSYVYDGTAKTPKFTCVDGYPSIITSNDVDIAFSDNVNAGTATATFTGKRNYTGTVEEEFDIGKAPLVIGAEAKTKVFGADDPTLTYTNSALFGTDRITGALAREEGNAVGAYAILQGTLTAGENYEITYFGADLTIRAPANAIWYVDATNGVDTADGFSWATAKKTIQAAVNLAVDGNQIIVTNGVYGPVIASRLGIEIRSVNGAATTIIDGGGTNRCATLRGNTNDVVKTTLSGFTLRNGCASDYGGGSKGGHLEFCIFSANQAVWGGGAYGALLENCILDGNIALDDGGGAHNSRLINCLVVRNEVRNRGSNQSGGGIMRCHAINCSIANNSAVYGISAKPGSAGAEESTLSSCIVYGNTYTTGETNDVYKSTATYSCIGSAVEGVGNIVADPLFVDAAHGDYRLSAASPCIDAGDSAFAPVGTDLDGNPRVMGDAVDMGCYEVQSISLSSPSITVALDGGPFTYDGTAHEPAAAVTNGAVALVADRDYSVSYLDNVNAGTARAIVTGLGVYVGSRTNEFEIAKRSLAIAADPQSKRRGENDPPLTYTAEPLIAGDSFSGKLEREPGETNGVYAITIGSLSAGDNYEIAFTGASLTISDNVPQLPGATIRWKYAASVGRYFAQVSIPAQTGYSESLGDLAFLFADRKSADGTIYAQLWDLPSRGPCEVVVTDNGVEYRGVALDASAFAGKADGTPVVFGVSDDTFAGSRNIVPSHERLIGLYVRKRVNPVSGNETAGEVENFIGYLSWTTGGTRYFLPVVEGADNGEVSTQAKRSLGRTSSGFSFAAMPHAYAPATLGLSVSLGLNAVAVAHDNPQVRISAFEVGADGSVRGRVEAVAGGEASSSFGSSATVVVFASETPAGPWKEVHAEVNSAIGTFALPAGTVTGHFFRVEVETTPIFE